MRALAVTESCPVCRAWLVTRHRRADGQPFIGCSRFPACRFTEPYDARLSRLAERVLQL
jgi:ssDNA-binding Zn-finger/Zn-ribbon topoisomerase 1